MLSLGEEALSGSQAADRSRDVFAVALYDYEATCPEELDLSEGQVLKILRKVRVTCFLMVGFMRFHTLSYFIMDFMGTQLHLTTD